METSGSDEWRRRPEFDKNNPATIFDYAKQKLEWINIRADNQVRKRELNEHLVEELEYHMTESFDAMPELTITARDVFHTKSIDIQENKVLMEIAPLPLEGDAEIYGEHAFQGRLFGFHIGINGDVRVYVSVADTAHQLMGGVYTSLLSVSVESADIRLSEVSVYNKRSELKKYITEQSQEFSDETRMLIAILYDVVDQQAGGPVLSLQACSPLIADIARSKLVTSQAVDALLELICLGLDLDGTHTIHASSYREVMTVRPVPSYKAKPGPALFEHITPELGLIGETASRGLGVFFINNDAAVQIPVQYITNMYKS